MTATAGADGEQSTVGELRRAAGIFVATDACKGCGACLATCPERALRPAPGGWLLRGEAPLVTLADRCTGCGECMEICPADAFVEQAA